MYITVVKDEKPEIHDNLWMHDLLCFTERVLFYQLLDSHVLPL